MAAILVVVTGVIAVAVAIGGNSTATVRRTGQINTMGMPIIENPGTASGTASAAGVTAEPEAWALGRIPLNMAVRPTWLLRNTGTDEITIGQPHAEVRQGCCPGPFTIDGPNTLAPGAASRISFELSMHPGMDGWHDMAIHVPVRHADGTNDNLTLGVTGDFRN